MNKKISFQQRKGLTHEKRLPCVIHIPKELPSHYLLLSTQASAATEWINESRDYSVGERVGNWQVLEYKDAVAYNANNVWTTEGVSGGIIDPLTDSSVLWFYYPGSYATVGFSQPSTSVAFMLESDGNDGLVNFYVDNAEVLHHFNMQTLPLRGSRVAGWAP